MILVAVGCNYRNTPVEVRERLVFDAGKLLQALAELSCRYGCESVILDTCNRVEIYLARGDSDIAPGADVLAEFLGEIHQLEPDQLRPYLYERTGGDAVRHLFRVASSLDSMIVGEGQIAAQVKQAYEKADASNAVGPCLHALFQNALQVSKRVRTETGIARGHVSVSSVAVDYVRQVFDHFHDKTILVIGAGKMGELTLKHLQGLKPKSILVTNHSPEKAAGVAGSCGGQAIGWDRLDNAMIRADIVLSTTGAAEPIMTSERYKKIRSQRGSSAMVILDIAVPRDFEPRIHDGDRTCLFNIDDLKRIRERTLADRLKHIEPAEHIIDQETRRFLSDLSRRQLGPVIASLKQDFEQKRREVVAELMHHLNGRLTAADREYIEGAFRLLENRLLHGPISALAKEASEEKPRHTLLDALRTLFRLQE